MHVDLTRLTRRHNKQSTWEKKNWTGIMKTLQNDSLTSSLAKGDGEQNGLRDTRRDQLEFKRLWPLDVFTCATCWTRASNWAAAENTNHFIWSGLFRLTDNFSLIKRGLDRKTKAESYWRSRKSGRINSNTYYLQIIRKIVPGWLLRFFFSADQEIIFF